MSEYDIDQCKTIILHLGGNDTDRGTDLETFAEKYEALIADLMTNERRIIVSGLSPRKTVDLSIYNDRLKSLCDAYEVEFVDNFRSFLLASGEIPDSYFLRDKVHLNNFGLRKLLSNIDRVHRITSQRQAFSPNKQTVTSQLRSGIRRETGTRNYATGRQFISKFCHICCREGHETRDCWFNARNNGWSGRHSR